MKQDNSAEQRRRQLQMQTPEALIFDMDGTLFRTETLIIPAYNRMFERLREEGLYEGEAPPVQILLGSLGMLLSDIWMRVMPSSDVTVHQRANELLLEEQMKGLNEGCGELYPGVKETLETLHGHGIRLFVASNGLEEYVKMVAEATGVAGLFEGLYSAGEYQTLSKVDLVKLLLSRSGMPSAWMVGDRSSDVEAGSSNGLPVVGCQYAEFGISGSELAGADMLISDFPDLLKLVHLD